MTAFFSFFLGPPPSSDDLTKKAGPVPLMSLNVEAPKSETERLAAQNRDVKLPQVNIFTDRHLVVNFKVIILSQLEYVIFVDRFLKI